MPGICLKPGAKKTGWMLLAVLLLTSILAIRPHPLEAVGENSSPAAGPPLGVDDITLLLIGGATETKLIPLIEQRGVSFRMTPDLAKKFHDLGASDHLIDVLSRAGEKAQASPSAPAASATPMPAAAPTSPTSPSAAAQPQAPPEPNAPDRGTATGGTKTAEDADLPAVGKPLGPAPQFSVRTLAGHTFNLSDEKGKVVLLDFWATWSKLCRQEVPQFMDLQKRYKSQGLRVVGIGVSDKLQNVMDFYTRYGMNYPVAMGDARLKAMFGGVLTIPTAVLIGRDGMIYYKVEGNILEPVIERQIRALLAAGAASPRPVMASATRPPVPSSAAPNNAAAPAHAVSSVTAQPAASTTPPKSNVALPDPSPAQIQNIIRAFAAKEKLFKQARENYTWHQVNKVETLDADGNVTGTYEQDWDILFDDNGKRIERVTYAPEDTLKGLIVTEQDIESFRNVQPFVLTTDDLPEYEVRYLGHVRVDYITAYVFSVRPKEIKKGREYFKGVIWVDDRDLQIVKAEGKQVPELNNKHGQNLFPRFTTWRQQIDGKYWFPTFTMADDTLYFNSGPVRIKEIIKYTDYKQFKSKIKISPATPITDPPAPANRPHP
jgi:thiol-disulfide isomerase/thioredoxin